MHLNMLPASEVNKIDKNKGVILDVRTKMEHDEKRLIQKHVLVTLDELNPTDFMMSHVLQKDFGVYILCRSGKRAMQAAEKFIAEGYTNIHVIDGGIMACEECGQKIDGYANIDSTQIEKPMSLERQVRIAAGSLIVVGAFLSLIISPVFGLIPLFVGVGLVYAGFTERCGMALMLANAPWNKKSNL